MYVGTPAQLASTVEPFLGREKADQEDKEIEELLKTGSSEEYKNIFKDNQDILKDQAQNVFELDDEDDLNRKQGAEEMQAEESSFHASGALHTPSARPRFRERTGVYGDNQPIT
jgi:hypothetical protein